jgi:alpha-L-rhamnosidase
MSIDFGEFSHPSSWWRSAPFWSWNYDLQPDRIASEGAELLKGGMGGYFMHSRYGLETEYFSKEWMDSIKAVVKEARSRHAFAWLYDEDRWPSGAAGGIVTENHPERRLKMLVAELAGESELLRLKDEGGVNKQLLQRFAVKMLRGKTKSFRHLKKDQWPRRGEKLLQFSRVINPDVDWYNRGAYLDNMNPEAVKAFIDHTYEGYKKEVGKEFGKTIPGMFTDEPNYYQPFHAGLPGEFMTVPWTDGLLTAFKKKCGYDLAPLLPHLFGNIDKSGYKIRRDFRKTCCELFEESFSKQVGRWCGKNNLALTGHFLGEESLRNQTQVIGSAMPHYMHMQLPGIDILKRSIKEVLTCKQVSSVAEQFGRERVLSETYGGAGWQFSLADQKWMGDWQYALGVNLRCQHLVLTSLRGGGKRDYPPSFFPHNPAWRHNNFVEDYFGRLSYVLSQGQAVRDLLVVHPIESAWACHTADASSDSMKQLAGLDKSFAGLLERLLGLHVDYDLGDESIMAQHGRVIARKLAVGRARYACVLLPEMLSMRSSTLKLLEKFAAAGGRILRLGALPILLEGQPSKRPAQVLKKITVQIASGAKALESALLENCGRRVSIARGSKQVTPIIYMLRKNKKHQVLFLANRDFDAGSKVKLTVSGAPSGGVEELDPQSGTIKKIAFSRQDAKYLLQLEVPAAGSRLLIFGAASGRAKTIAQADNVVSRRELGKTSWKFRRDEPNALVLDLCRYRLRGSKLSAPTNILKVAENVRQQLGYRQEANYGVMRWKAYLAEDLKNPKADGALLELNYEFQVKKIPGGNFSLALERPELFRIMLNGCQVSSTRDGNFLDPDIGVVELPKPKRGRNCLQLITGFRPEHYLEAIYLLGDFGVTSTSRREIIAEPTRLKTGSWVKQGYPHYSSGITYIAEETLRRPEPGQRVFLVTSQPGGVSMELSVNGRKVGLMPWAPYELDVTRYLSAGGNRFELTVLGSRRNLLGPLHLTGTEQTLVGPSTMTECQPGQENKYNLIPMGLTGAVRLEYRSTC